MRGKPHNSLSNGGLLSIIILPAFLSALFWQDHAKAEPVKYCESKTTVLKLPGGLNDIPTFNSNSPEQVLNPGILLSTFPPDGMRHPEAHLNFLFDGRFDVFSHHVAKNESSEDDRTLFLGFVAGNPSNKKVRIQVLSGASYLSQPDAPFISLPAICQNDDGKIFAGPGDRVSNDVLRGAKAGFLPKSISIPPGQNKLILCLAVPVRKLRPALNGRSTLLELKSSGPVYLASMALFAPESSKDGPPESAWLEALNNEGLCSPRDDVPTPIGAAGRIKYGRVAGVARGTEWDAVFSDAFCASESESDLAEKKSKTSADRCFSIPKPGNSFTVPLSTVEAGTFGSKQVQAAPLLLRYPDTAYQAHGNYGVKYKIDLPLYNDGRKTANVELLFQSALKSNEHKNGVCFYEDAPPRAFFRGTVCVQQGSKKQYWHLVQRQGDEGAKLAELNMPPGSRSKISVELIYPPDATPPQELCIRTCPEREASE